ncbi:MAG: ubiquinone biosynthesis protein UbiH [Sideroxydans sp.]|nr:ubiquinone biosynthesis protein UbiH [Sideroxydans sp.]
MTTDQHCDVAIIGGGPVGLALALAMRGSGLNIHVLEARKAENAGSDPRALALSYGSRLLLDRLGVWHDIAQVSPIKTIHISQKHALGRAVLRAAELDVPELGYVLPYPALHNALQQALHADGISYQTGAAVTQLLSETDGARISYQHDGVEHVLSAHLAVVADGGKLLETSHPPEITDYGQSALVTHITCQFPKADTAFERFTTQGPVALLPYKDGYELVWTASHEQAQQMLQWDDATFLARLHEHFGDRVGSFINVGTRSCFPLRLRRAPDTTLPHTVLLGNAAQTLHPVAGQGFNMGLRDAWELAQAMLACAPEALGSATMLEDYRKSRRLDRNAGIRFTDGLVRMFSNDLPLLSGGRAASLSMLDCLPLAKKFIAKRMMFGANG